MASMPDHPPFSDMPVPARPVVQPIATDGAPEAGLHFDLPNVSRGGAALDLLLISVVVLTPYLLSMYVDAAFQMTEEKVPPAALLRVHKWAELLIAVVLLAYMIARHRMSARSFGLRIDGLGKQLLLAPLTLIGVYVAFIPSVLIVAVIVMLFPETQHDLEGRYRLISALADESLSDTILLMIPVAIQEEIVFRGLMIPYLRRLGMGWIGAALISTAIFASLHIAQGGLGIVQVFSLGLAFAAAFILTRSLIVVILAHFGFNTIQLVLAPIVFKWAESAGGLPAT